MDTNTKGHCQWFYFAVTNTEKNRTVIFNILNCTNPVTLFKNGMKPLVFSEIEFEESGSEWLPDTSNAVYNKNNIPRNPLQKINTDSPQENQNCNTYYTLSFSYTFKHSADKVYFAYSRPYTVSKHCTLLRYIQEELASKAKNFTMLDEDGLQKRIRQFLIDETNGNTQAEEKKQNIKNDIKSNNIQKQKEEDQLKIKKQRKRKEYNAQNAIYNHNSLSKVPEAALVGAEILKQYHESENKNQKLSWIKGQDFQLETEDMIYRQETLSHTFCGFPVELITITSHQ